MEGRVATFLRITPQMAKEFLTKNNANRTVNQGRVNQYARDIQSGLWQANGEAIKFYVDGSLADGQHRLLAIIKADKEIETLVIYNLPLGVTIQDRGRSRSVIDSMVLEGTDERLAKSLFVGMANLHYVIQTSMRNVSDGEVKRFISNNSKLLLELFGAIPKGKKNRKTINVKRASIMLACFYAVNSGGCSVSDVAEFLDVLYTGIPKSLSQTAVLVCRDDIVSKTIRFGSVKERIRAERQIEKALCDFLNKYQRKNTYGSWDKPIYSVCACNTENVEKGGEQNSNDIN